MEFKAEIIDMNTDDQLLDKGSLSSGSAVVPGYRPLTIQIKGVKGQETRHVTLKDTGDFHGSFFINRGENWFTLSADDPKAQSLERKYSAEIYGLTEGSVANLVELIRDPLLNTF